MPIVQGVPLTDLECASLRDVFPDSDPSKAFIRFITAPWITDPGIDRPGIDSTGIDDRGNDGRGNDSRSPLSDFDDVGNYPHYQVGPPFTANR